MKNIYIQSRIGNNGIYITFSEDNDKDSQRSIYHTEDIKNKDEMMIMFQKDIVYPYIEKMNIKDVKIITENHMYNVFLEKEKELTPDFLVNKRMYQHIRSIKNKKESLELSGVNITEKIEENNEKLNLIYNEILDLDNIKVFKKLYFSKKNIVKNTEKMELDLFKIQMGDKHYIGYTISSEVDGKSYILEQDVSLPKIPTVLKVFKNLLKQAPSDCQYNIKTNYKGLEDIENFSVLDKEKIIKEKISLHNIFYEKTANQIDVGREINLDFVDKYKADIEGTDKDTVVIYSDGSRKEDRVTAGYGITVLKKGSNEIAYKIKGRIDNKKMHISSTKSEAHGILRTLTFIKENRDTYFKNVETFEIRCDNLSVAQHFANDIKHKDFESMDEILKEIKANISFKWVRGHADDEVNTITDKLAREGASLDYYGEIIEKVSDKKIKFSL